MVTVSALWSNNHSNSIAQDAEGNLIYNCIGIDDKGNQVQIGRSPQCITPGQLLLISLAGCVTLSMARILQASHQEFSVLSVQVTGHQPDVLPKLFTSIDVQISIQGKHLSPMVVERSIQLTKEKYCVVGLSLENHVKVNTTYILQESLNTDY